MSDIKSSYKIETNPTVIFLGRTVKNMKI